MKFPLNLIAIPKGSWPEIGVRVGLYQLHDGRPVHCTTEHPYPNAVQTALPDEEARNSRRFYQVFDLQGTPQFLVLSQWGGGIARQLVADLGERARSGRLDWTPLKAGDL